MSLVAYVVHDVETGEVVHVHVEAAELGSLPEEIATIADVGHPERLRAVRLPANELSRDPGRIVDGELRATDGVNWGGAGTGGGDAEPGLGRRYHAQFPEPDRTEPA
jgi:hypothetical protein